MPFSTVMSEASNPVTSVPNLNVTSSGCSLRERLRQLDRDRGGASQLDRDVNRGRPDPARCSSPGPCKSSWCRTRRSAPCGDADLAGGRVDHKGARGRRLARQRVGQSIVGLIVAVVVGRPGHRLAHRACRRGSSRRRSGSRFCEQTPGRCARRSRRTRHARRR